MTPTLTSKQIFNLDKIREEFEAWFVVCHLHKLDLDNLEGCIKLLATLEEDIK